jgi:RNA polymerase sigma-70 factor (sigma-E family)
MTCQPPVAAARATSVLMHATVYAGPLLVSGPSTWDADQALDQLYAAHWRSLVRLAVLLVHDVSLAEEIVQDSFVAVHGRWRGLRDPDRALAYLRQTVVNRGRSALRHRGVVERHAERDRPVTTMPGADASVMADDRRDRVLDALRGLPARQREVLALRYYSELSEAEIADALGISRGAVKSHASRGAAALRVTLADYLEDRS